MKRLLSIIVLFVATSVAAQVPFFPTSDARVVSMGGVSLTSVTDSHSLYSNATSPLYSQYQSAVSTSYNSFENGYKLYTVSGSYNFNGRDVVQLGWRRFGVNSDADMSFDAAYARRVNERWAVGGTLHYYCFDRLSESRVNAVAVDFSAMYSLPIESFGMGSTLRTGARLSNLGGVIGEDIRLPMSVAIGTALDTYITDAHEVTLGVDVEYCYTPEATRGARLSLGAEYNLMQLLQLRAGYHVDKNNEYRPNYASIGAGVRFMHLRADFAYLFAQSNTLLHNSWSISFGLDF